MEQWNVDITLKSHGKNGMSNGIRMSKVRNLEIEEDFVSFTTPRGKRYMIRTKEIVYLTVEAAEER